MNLVTYRHTEEVRKYLEQYYLLLCTAQVVSLLFEKDEQIHKNPVSKPCKSMGSQ